VAYLPKEKIAVAGDLIRYPIPYIYDRYPVEWIQTTHNLNQLDADTIAPGHRPITHDKTYISRIRDLLKSPVDQMNAEFQANGPSHVSDSRWKGAVDIRPFRHRFAGSDQDLTAGFDDMAANPVKVVFEEASLR
jgi:cyclase